MPRERPRLEPWIKGVAPLALAVLLVWSALPVFGSRGGEFVGWIVAYVVPPLGKETVIPALLARGYPAWLVTVYILALDILGGLFVVWNYERLQELPRVGPHLRRIQERFSAKLQDKPWAANLGFAGIVLYIAFPLQGSGGVMGALVGRTLGMPPYRVLAAVILGSALANLLVVNLSDLALWALRIGWVWAAGILVGGSMVAYSLIQTARRRLAAPAS